MLYNYFIVLCFGVYASCARAQQTPSPERIKESIGEIRNGFCNIKEKLEKYVNRSLEPLDIPENGKNECVRVNLKKYVGLLTNTQFCTKEHVPTCKPCGHFCWHLQNLSDTWGAMDEKTCQTTRRSKENLPTELAVFLLKDLPAHVNLTRKHCPQLRRK